MSNTEANMSPAQTEETLKRDYHLALSQIRPSQDTYFQSDYHVKDVSPARMKLVIEQLKNQD